MYFYLHKEIDKILATPQHFGHDPPYSFHIKKYIILIFT